MGNVNNKDLISINNRVNEWFAEYKETGNSDFLLGNINALREMLIIFSNSNKYDEYCTKVKRKAENLIYLRDYRIKYWTMDGRIHQRKIRDTYDFWNVQKKIEKMCHENNTVLVSFAALDNKGHIESSCGCESRNTTPDVVKQRWDYLENNKWNLI